MHSILAIGEVMLEMSDLGDGLYKKSFAGDTFNVLHYLGLLTDGQLQMDYLTMVGEDTPSAECLAFLRAHGVPTGRCLRHPSLTIGMFIISNDDRGEKQYAYWRGQAAARRLFDETRDLSGYDTIYLSGITAAITEGRDNLLASVAEARATGSRVIYDFNHRRQLWSPEAARDFAASILQTTDLAKISDEELDWLYAMTSPAALSAEFPQVKWLLTCGGEKAEVWQAGEVTARRSFTPAAEVVDSSAAGDSFLAAYLAAEREGAPEETRLERGHFIATQVIGGKGSIVPVTLK